MLGTEGSNPLVAYHISPFVLTVCKRVNDKNICDINKCYLQYSGNSPLILNNGITLASKSDGWQIPKHSLINSNIEEKFSLVTENDFYILKDDIQKDRIEIAVDFINEII